MLALQLVLAGALVVALFLIPRPVSWQRAMPLLIVAGFVLGFGLASWAISLLFVGAGRAAERAHALGLPLLGLFLGPLVVVGVLGFVDRRRRERATASRPAESLEYRDDRHWYSSDWRQRAQGADVDLGTAGYRLELVDGPLAGRTARLRDSRFRLWVAARDGGGELIVRGAIERPALQGVSLLGSYGFSHGDEALVWTPFLSPNVPA